MDKKEAIELLKQALTEIPNLKELDYDNEYFQLWFDKVKQVISSALGKDDLNTFISTDLPIPVIDSLTPPTVRQNHYIKRLGAYEVNIKKIIQKYELLGFDTKPSTMPEIPPKAFIAHGGDSPALGKLKDFLVALGVQPLVVEEQPSEGRSVGENVDWYSRQADCAIILATKGDIDAKTGGFIPRGNVLIEIGKLQELFKDRIIYLLQAGTRFPTIVSEKAWGRFTTQCMDDAFIKVARELYKFGLLKAVKS